MEAQRDNDWAGAVLDSNEHGIGKYLTLTELRQAATTQLKGARDGVKEVCNCLCRCDVTCILTYFNTCFNCFLRIFILVYFFGFFLCFVFVLLQAHRRVYFELNCDSAVLCCLRYHKRSSNHSYFSRKWISRADSTLNSPRGLVLNNSSKSKPLIFTVLTPTIY